MEWFIAQLVIEKIKTVKMKCDEGFKDTDSNFLGKKICNLRKGAIELFIIESH